MNKYGLIGFALTLVFVAQAKADFIYRLSDDQKSSAHILEALDRAGVKDKIPQINVFVTERLIEQKLDIRSLGTVKTIQLPETRTRSLASSLWGMRAIQAEEAWALSQGEGIIVGVSDTGIDGDHPDLAQNMWINKDEIPGNNIDDDGNGYVDDIQGWNFVKKRPGGTDNHYHGTHVAGTIGAKVGEKISGVAPKVTLMDASFLGASGSGKDADGAKSIIYLVDNGAKVINCSWGGPGESPIIEEAIKYAMNKGVLVVVAAGNNSSNNDRKKFFPATSNVENILAVAASSNEAGAKASFSNFGKTTVEVAAPGGSIRSTSPSSSQKARYRTLSGTSMASPHVAGIAALVWSRHPAMDWAQVKETVVGTVKFNKNWATKVSSAGVANALNAVSQ